MVFAVRESADEPVLAGLPELVVHGLSSRDAGGLLDASVPGVLDPGVRDRILAESRGNPLALLELPRGLSATELAFGAVAAADAPPWSTASSRASSASSRPCRRSRGACSWRRPPSRSATSRCCGAP